MSAIGRFLSAAAFGGAVAALLVLVGTRDMEGYDHAFFSLDRGTALEAVEVLGHPVYTLGLGLGVRLPLHGNLGASPAAAVAPLVPAPLAYWLLVACAIAAALLVVRHALEPLCGRAVVWMAAVLLFCSLPIVNYAIYDDWPETVLTYCAFVACVSAPHALLALLARERLPLLGAGLAAGTTGALLSASHQGYWPLLAVTLVLAGVLALVRPDHAMRRKMTAVAVLGVASLAAVALQVPDILRELSAAGADIEHMRRFVQGPTGHVVFANLFPFGEIGPRRPFTFLLLAIGSMCAGLAARDSVTRRLAVGGAVVSFVLGWTASFVEPGSGPYSPSVTWAFRDPAIAFAVFSGAVASRAWRRDGRVGWPLRIAAALLVAGALQGPVYAIHLTGANTTDPVFRNVLHPRWRGHTVWTRDLTPPGERAAQRGFGRANAPEVRRLAFWPGTRARMREARHATTDFADAGYPLVTAWTKQRTMHGLVRPNELIFNQTIDLSPPILCDAEAVAFLQLGYLILPPEIDCPPWARLPGAIVDGWWQVAAAPERDDRIRTIPSDGPSDAWTRAALTPDSTLLGMLEPLPGSAVRIGPRTIDLQLGSTTQVSDRVLVLPVAFDAAWHASSGATRSVGGLLGIAGAADTRIALQFVPDAAALLRSLGMTLSQVLTIAGLVGLAWLRPGRADQIR